MFLLCGEHCILVAGSGPRNHGATAAAGGPGGADACGGQAAKKLGLRHVDAHPGSLPDGGASSSPKHGAGHPEAVPGARQMLDSDMKCMRPMPWICWLIPEVLNHNVERRRELQAAQARYERSLKCCATASERSPRRRPRPASWWDWARGGADRRRRRRYPGDGRDILTIGHLQPSPQHYPLARSAMPRICALQGQWR